MLPHLVAPHRTEAEKSYLSMAKFLLGLLVCVESRTPRRVGWGGVGWGEWVASYLKNLLSMFSTSSMASYDEAYVQLVLFVSYRKSDSIKVTH